MAGGGKGAVSTSGEKKGKTRNLRYFLRQPEREKTQTTEPRESQGSAEEKEAKRGGS